jgi:hypothetical protein
MPQQRHRSAIGYRRISHKPGEPNGPSRRYLLLMPNIAEPLNRAAANRDLAKRARWLAHALPPGGANRTRLVHYAEELEQRAAGLEKQVSASAPAASAPAASAPATTRQVQTQVQQQRLKKTPLKSKTLS